MKTSKELLHSVLKTTQMGQIGLRSILDKGPRPALRNAVKSQLREYDDIEQEAWTIASQRGWEMQELEPATRLAAHMRTRMKVRRDTSDSKIAGMVIQDNTKGMISGLKNLHQYPYPDDRISAICQKLLDCQTANIRQMQNYL